MSIDELLSVVEDTARANNISRPFIVGGVPRDRVLGNRGKISGVNDIDITTGNSDAAKLAGMLSRSIPGSNFRTYDDGHSSLDVRGLHIDFSSNFTVPGIEDMLKKDGVKDITPMKMELYSRDFTINTLLESLDFSSMYDLTGDAMDDIKAGIVRCPIDPKITIGTDPRRILRAIKFSIKYGFDIDDGLKIAMLNNRKKIKDLPLKFVQDKMGEIVKLDDDKGVEMLIEYKLLTLVPLTKTIYDILIQKRKLVRAL